MSEHQLEIAKWWCTGAIALQLLIVAVFVSVEAHRDYQRTKNKLKEVKPDRAV